MASVTRQSIYVYFYYYEKRLCDNAEFGGKINVATEEDRAAGCCVYYTQQNTIHINQCWGQATCSFSLVAKPLTLSLTCPFAALPDPPGSPGPP